MPLTPTIDHATGMLAGLTASHVCTQACTGTARLGDGTEVTLSCPWGRLDMSSPADRRLVQSVYASEALAAMGRAVVSESNLPALQAELERVGAEAARWAEVEASQSTALVHTGSGDPEQAREQMMAVRREAAEKTRELRAASEKVQAEIRAEVDRQRELLRAQEQQMREQMAAALAALEPLQQQVKQMKEGIWTVNLYLGTREEVVTLREGTPAPIDAPIHMRTSVLAMDEEVAAFPQTAEGTDWQGMDFRDIEMFDRWLIEHPDHLSQVLPEERGIVVFTPRRTAKTYSTDPFVDSAMNEENLKSYWLIRNGESLYRLHTDFGVGRTLMPVTSEFTALFQITRYNPETRQSETVEITPGTAEWREAEEQQDAKRRHYMRVALIVQGLVDRTEMLAPLHAGVSFMSQRTYDDGLVVVVNDTDNMLTSGREPYADWIRRHNADLRPGMRVLGTFRGPEWDEHEFRGDWSRAEGNQRLSPATAERPPTNTLLLIEDRRKFKGQSGLVVRYDRTTQVWDEKLWVPSQNRPGWGHRGGYRTPKTRASAVILPSDTCIIPFDLVTETEMQDYLAARTERHAYVAMFPLLQAAIEAKRNEREAEAPFHDLLTRVLADDNDQDLDEVAPHIDGLVHRFKLGNKWHRPLVSLSSEDEAKALRLIRAEYKRVVSSGADDERDTRAVEVLRAQDASIMFVGRLSSGKYVAFAPQPRQYGEGVVAQDLWVREHTTGKTARTVATRDWVVPGVRGNKMTALYTSDSWAAWDTQSTAKSDLTDDELTYTVTRAKQRCLEALRAAHGSRVEYLGVGHGREKNSIVVYGHDGVHGAPARAKVSDPEAKSTWVAAIAQWTRGSDGEVSTELRTDRFGSALIHTEPYRLAPTGSMWDKTPDEDRALVPPWETGSRHLPTPVMVEVDEQTLAIAERVTRVWREANRGRDAHLRKIRTALNWIEEQQVDVQIEAIKATFLADYPDESMWQERKSGLTNGARAQVQVTDRWHFKERRPVGGTGDAHTLHDLPPENVKLDDMLAHLIDGGTTEWDDLTVEDGYERLGLPVPEVYGPIRDLWLAAHPEDDTSV